ncbi:DUF4129 domain-containing protein [Lignipirellula cremea]|uniref:Protein-glutamine gamma-glutamyltransferase-like C-terminal domain-containing protein n=1 Tax=Lignipirellula cremea TaxID=2528010 RepID=A0A518E3P8_9BACT|nr:DUF4129 domain-containing protein [Lignipirellula cremea]QDU98725.1 hypothetical protein Pla8534_65980 [Lignipirellula cremea]
MHRRFPPTAVDYLIMAINPTLIIAMILGLLFFLAQCLYHGPYPGRLNLILFCFTVGAVLITRIAIEQGRSHAAGFAVCLGGATLLAMSRFVEYSGPLAGLGLLLNVFFLGLAWWMADRITLDCTLIDETQDASGAGLLQGGLLSWQRPTEPGNTELDGVATSAEEPTDPRERPASPRQGHRPGRWILYFALAALPLFGLGQMLLPAGSSNTGAWFCLALYMASALALLVSTSLLGLRRYLRQRNVEMPPNVTAGWMGGGGILILALLAVCFLAPLPGRWLARFNAGSWIESPARQIASRFGWGKEGANDPQSKAPATAPQNQEETEQDGQRQDGKQQDGKQQDGKQQDGQQQDGKQQDGKQQDGKQQDGKQQDGKQQDGKQQDGEQQDGEQQDGKQQDGEQQDDKQQDRPAPSPEKSSDPAPDEEQAETPSSGQQAPRPSTPPAVQKPPFSLADVVRWIGFFFKFLIALVLGTVVAIFARRHWDQFLAWWARLGWRPGPGTAVATAEPVAPPTPPRPFSSFPHPLSARLSPEQSVLLMFAALEAWGREAGVGRGEEQTPSEYAASLRRPFPPVGAAAGPVAELYNHYVYGGAPIPPSQLPRIETLWAALQQHRPAVTPPPIQVAAGGETV